MRHGHPLGRAALLACALFAVAALAWADADPTSAGEIPVPELPFATNPDPDACGIPTPWGPRDEAVLDGHVEGELVEPLVHLYDSHLRSAVTGLLPSGSEVRIVLYQNNPVLDFYLVRGTAEDGTVQEGWVPAPFLRVGAP